MVNQTSEPLLLLLSWLRQMHRHFMEVSALLDELREAYMRREDDRRTDGRLSGLVLTIAYSAVR